ncbi:glycine-rich domain-containing protein [Parasphingopyxis marina]|uniref:glycine-rich domain-containing protein n=1 Tax=Parasphingopyxis marina TaxID=2761622 RepID=UPI001F43CA2A|nr:hypothetical protein [Parasphingopyxis marina]
MTPTDDPLWQRLEPYAIGPPDAALSFCSRLARENRWPEDFAGRVIEEYKRFCYLCATADHVVTPSDAVDQAWHLHLTYSRDYWERFCPEILGCPLHHGPTAGGEAELAKHYEQYALTLRSYAQVFGNPPGDIWPGARRRFFEDHKAYRLHPREAIVMRRSIARWLVGTGAVALLGVAFIVWRALWMS